MNKEELKKLSTIIFPDKGVSRESIEYEKNLIENIAQKIIKEKINGTLTEGREASLKNKLYSKLDNLDRENYFKKDCYKAFKSLNFYKIIYNDDEFISERKFVFIKSASESLRILVNYGLEGKDLTSFWSKFEQRFYFNLKDSLLKIMNEDNGYEENEYKIGLIKVLFRNIVEKNNYEKDIRKNLKEKINKISNINKVKLKQFLVEKLNGTEIDIKKLEDIFNKNVGMINLDAPLEIEENSSFLDISKEDNINLKTKEDLKNDLWKILEKSKSLISSIQNKSLSIYLKALISVNIFQYEAEYGYCLELHDYVDTDFEVFYKNRKNKSMDFDDVIADYLNKKQDTVRKYARKIKEQRLDLEAMMNLTSI